MPTFCRRCGEPLSTHDACDRSARPGTAFDPPRFCGDCGARLTIQVAPAGYAGVCLRCERRARTSRARGEAA